jgi:hypothetical protein
MLTKPTYSLCIVIPRINEALQMQGGRNAASGTVVKLLEHCEYRPAQQMEMTHYLLERL